MNGADDMLAGCGTPRNPWPEGSTAPRQPKCTACMLLEFADEEGCKRLARYHINENQKLQNRLLSEGDRRELEQRIRELEQNNERLNATIARRTR